MSSSPTERRSAVAEMVDIVNGTDAVRKADEIVDG